MNRCIWLAAGLISAGLFLPEVSNAQSMVDNPLTRTDSIRAGKKMQEEYLSQVLGDSKEEAAYQAFHNAPLQDPDKKIKLGDAFLAKFPGDRYTAAVYEELCYAYYEKKDLASFYTFSDKGLALFPDDVHLLALSGWVTPRAFTPDEPAADKKLDEADSQAKHALDVVSKMEKPTNFTDEQFAQFKTGEAAMAHSGLGLIHFRREQYEESAKELQIAILGETNPDPTDLFILGADLENLSRFKEAADAFNRCAQITGGMQGKCKQYASNAMKRAAEAR